LVPARWSLYIGPDKAGSSWMHRLVSWHEQVASPHAKDLFFFDRFFERGEDWYFRQFPVDAKTTTCVEICHDYLYSVEAADRIAATLGAPRLIVCARDPVDRAVSAYHYLYRQGRIRSDFSTAIREVDELIGHGQYARHIDRYLQRHRLEQFRVLDFAQLGADPHGFAQELFRAIGVDVPVLVPEDLLSVARPAAEPKSPKVAAFGKRTAEAMRRMRMERAVGVLKTSPVVEKALFRPLAAEDRAEVSPEDREYLAEHLVDDARRLDELFGSSFATRWWPEA
jgi:hypothetical protein